MTNDEIRLAWNGGLDFTAQCADFETRIDGDLRKAPSPVNLLIESVAACAAIDVVLILQKGRQNIAGLAVTARATRADTAPRFVKGLHFDFTVSGTVDAAKARRAVGLSFEKYCSVYHSLREDIELEWTVAVESEPAS